MAKCRHTLKSVNQLLDNVYDLTRDLCKFDLEFVEVFVGSSNVLRLHEIADLVHKLSLDVTSQITYHKN